MAIKIQGTTVIDDTRIAEFVNLSLSGTGAAKMPAGSTAQRPAGAIAGQLRFNADLGKFEGFDGTEWGLIAGGGGGTGGAVPWIIVTANYTASSTERIVANTTSNAFTITLPANPGPGDTVQIMDGGDWTVNNLTVARNGRTIEGYTEDLLLNVKGVIVDFVYDGTTWQVAATTGPRGPRGAGAYISTTFPNALTTPFIGTNRRYIVEDVVLSFISAFVSTPPTENVIIQIYKNEVLAGTATIVQGEYYVALIPLVDFTCEIGDYLTINITSGNPTNLTVLLYS